MKKLSVSNEKILQEIGDKDCPDCKSRYGENRFVCMTCYAVWKAYADPYMVEE